MRYMRSRHSCGTDPLLPPSRKAQGPLLRVRGSYWRESRAATYRDARRPCKITASWPPRPPGKGSGGHLPCREWDSNPRAPRACTPNRASSFPRCIWLSRSVWPLRHLRLIQLASALPTLPTRAPHCSLVRAPSATRQGIPEGMTCAAQDSNLRRGFSPHDLADRPLRHPGVQRIIQLCVGLPTLPTYADLEPPCSVRTQTALLISLREPSHRLLSARHRGG